MESEGKYLNIVMEDGSEAETSILKETVTFYYRYASLSFSFNTSENTYFCSGVIDDKYNTVVPFRVEPKYDDMKNDFDLVNYTQIFKNDTALFQVDKSKFFLIDLNKTKFVKNKNDFIMPNNCIYVMNGFELINDKLIIINSDKKYFLYDVLKQKRLTYSFDFMECVDGVIYAVLFLKTLTYNPVMASFIISKTGKIKNEVTIDDQFTLYLGKNELKNIKTIRRALNPVIYYYYKYFDDEMEEQLCKIKQ